MDFLRDHHDLALRQKMIPGMPDLEMIEDTARIANGAGKSNEQVSPIIGNHARGETIVAARKILNSGGKCKQDWQTRDCMMRGLKTTDV
jgi:hypothetical protein